MIREYTIHGEKLESLANKREHWAARSKRAKRHRMLGRLMGLKVGADVGKRGGVLTITRIAPRALDSDNLAISAKNLRDGVADAFGIDDRDERVRWAYAQEQGPPKHYGIRISWSPEGPP